MKPVLDIIFPDTYSLYSLGIADVSTYPNLFVIDRPFIEITPPGLERKVIKFSPKGLNLFNSNTLGVTCSEDGQYMKLPDGIWTFKYSITPVTDYFVEKTFMRVNQIKARFETLFLNMECDDVNKMDEIDSIWYYIQGAIASANDCNTKQALNLYRLASDKINNLNGKL